MGHPDDGLIQTLLDGEIEGTEAETLRAHLESCPECRAGVEALEEASRETARALLLVDTDPRLEKVRIRAQARDRFQAPDRQRPGARRFFGSSLSLPKAASIALLLTGAAVTALPGSPVRRWMAQGWDTLTESFRTGNGQDNPQGTSGDPTAPSPETRVPETGASIPALSQGVEIWIHDLPSEAELRVVWVDGDEAWIYAGEGTRFSREAGRLEAFGPPGAVRVEIPRNLRQLLVGLDGNVLLRKSGDEVEILGPVQQRTPSEILFETPGSTRDGQFQGVIDP
jgi:hypothetical protein